MTRRDLALIVLSGGISGVVSICVTILCALDKLSGATTAGVLTTIAALGGVAVSRLSGGPPQNGEVRP